MGMRSMVSVSRFWILWAFASISLGLAWISLGLGLRCLLGLGFAGLVLSGG
jgi:hypothetical protein